MSNATTQFQLCYHLQSNANALETKDMHFCKCLHSAYGFMRLNIKMKVKKIRQLPRNFQILAMYLDEWLHFSLFTHPSIYPKLKLSWWVPWLGNQSHNKLPKTMACNIVNTNIATYGFVNTPAQVPWSRCQDHHWQLLSFQGKAWSLFISNPCFSVSTLPYGWHSIYVWWMKWND